MKRLVLYILAMLMCVSLYAQKHTADHYDHAIRQAFQEQRWDAGKYMIDEAEPYYGNLSTFYELKGWYYYHLKDYKQSRYMLSKCIQDDNMNTHAKDLLSKVEEDTKHYSSAICYINELLENNAYDRTLWLRKIDMYRKLGNGVEADKLLRRLAEIYPNDPKVKGILDEQFSINLREAKRSNNVNAQLSIAKDLVDVNPTAENFISYVNILIGAGYTNQALDVIGLGIKKTGSFALAKKKCDILCDQGKYTEALNFLANNYKNNAQAQRLKSDIEKMQAMESVQYDPYIQYQKLYYKLHTKEAFNFIVNTALSRGYYYDVLDFIADYKKRTGITIDLLYKEYTAYKRLGDNDKALVILDEISRREGHNAYADELSEGYYKQATNLIADGQYNEAISKLKYIIDNSSDDSLIKNAQRKLYTCYIETNELDSALLLIDENDVTKKSDILCRQGKYKQALKLVASKDSIAYSEISVIYIKKLIEEHKYDIALQQCKEALVYTDVKEIYMYAISCSSRLNKEADEYILAGIERFPVDDYFINQYCGLLNTKALRLRKQKKYEEALNIVNEGLEYNPNDKDLLITKGLLYENMKQYELAYNFQKGYTPTVLEEYDFKKRMQGMKTKTYNNTITAMYEFYRTESQDVHKSTAGISYSHTGKKNSYDIIINYTSRDDISDVYDYTVGTKSGGPAIQIGGAYQRQFNKGWSIKGTGLIGTKYFPIITAGIGVEKEIDTWTLQGGLTYKFINSWSRPDSISWTKDKYNLFDINLGFTKLFDPYLILTSKVDLFSITGQFYINTSHIINYFPIEGNKSKLYGGFGIGTAPEMSLTNNIVPMSQNKLNTFLTLGGLYYLNEHIGLSLAGSWYSLYNETPEHKVQYSNLFYVHTNLIIKF